MTGRRAFGPQWFGVVAGVILSASAAGCASAAARKAELSADQVPADKALVYFLRVDGVFFPGTAWILEDESLLAAVGSRAYTPAFLDPGPHWIWTRKTGSTPEDYQRGLFFFEAGHTYGLRFVGGGQFLPPRSDAIVPVSPRALEYFIEKLPEFHRAPVTAELRATMPAAIQGHAPSEGTPPRLPPGLREKPSPGKELVYFFAPQSWSSPTWVMEGDRTIALLHGSGYASAEFTPGLHRLWTIDKEPTFVEQATFVFEAGRISSILVDANGSMTERPADGEILRLSANPRFGPSAPTADQRREGTEMALRHAAIAGPLDLPPCTAADIPPGELRLAAGTAIPLRLTENATSFNTPLGATLRLEVAEDVRLGETTVVPRGLPVQATVSEVKPSSAGHFGGILGVEARRIGLPDGRAVPILGLFNSIGSPKPTQKALQRYIENPPDIRVGASSYAPAAEIGSFGAVLLLSGILKGGDAWMLAGGIGSAQVRCDTAVGPSPALQAARAPAPRARGSPIAAQSLVPIVVPPDGRVKAEWCARLDLKSPPTQVRIASVDGNALSHGSAGLRTTPAGDHLEVCFPAWPVVRFVVLEATGTTKAAVVLEGTLADGTFFFAPVTVSLVLGEK